LAVGLHPRVVPGRLAEARGFVVVAKSQRNGAESQVAADFQDRVASLAGEGERGVVSAPRALEVVTSSGYRGELLMPEGLPARAAVRLSDVQRAARERLGRTQLAQRLLGLALHVQELARQLPSLGHVGDSLLAQLPDLLVLTPAEHDG